jgi:hypothetical protein
VLAEDAAAIPVGARLLPSRLHESWACSVVGAVVCWDLEQKSCFINAGPSRFFLSHLDHRMDGDSS